MAYEGLEKVAGAINKIPNPVRLEGHTDSLPIRTARFHSNWELSATRSIALLELLSTRFGVSRQRMSIAGYADSAPIASHETEEGRARNRRADIVILNEQGVMAEPARRRTRTVIGFPGRLLLRHNPQRLHLPVEMAPLQTH